MNFIDLKAQQGLIQKDLEKRIKKVLSHGKYIMGPEVVELESILAKFIGSKYCVTVSSGTDALLISLMSLGVKPGDEVITSPFSWVSTAEVIVLLGAIPIFVDIDPDTCNIDHYKIEEKINSKTKVIMPVSLFGQPSDMSFINKIAKKHNVPVIEDAAQSFGAMFKNKKSCNLSKVGCTSFFPSKPLGCYGDGGAIFTNDKKIMKVCKELRLNGQENKNKFNRIGIQGRLDTIQAAVLLAKMKVFPKEARLRNKIGSVYDEMMDKAGIKHVVQKKNTKGVFAQYTIFSKGRAKLSKNLELKKIPHSIYYSKPIYFHKPYNRFKTNCKNAEELSKKVISIPMHPYLSKSNQNFIVDAVKEIEVNS